MESIQIAKSFGERPDILFTVFENNIHQIERVWFRLDRLIRVIEYMDFSHI